MRSSARTSRGAQCLQRSVGVQFLFRHVQSSILYAVVQDGFGVIEAAWCFLLVCLETGVLVFTRCLVDDSQRAAHVCDVQCA